MRMEAPSCPPPGPIGSPLVYLSSHYIRAKEYLEAILASTSDAICTTDLGGRVIYFSPGAERMTGLAAQEIVGLPAHSLYENGRREGSILYRLLLEKGWIESHETVLRIGHRRIHVSMSAALLRDKDGRIIGTLGISKDISRRVELERRLRELSVTDDLTGLFNQRHLRERLASEAQRARRQRMRLSLFLIDLDRFKEVNDRFGHLEGDRRLKATAAAVSSSIRRGVDAAFRYGGDEFVVLLPGLGLKRAEAVAERVRLALRRARVEFSHGSACLRPREGWEELLRRADLRMYRMKRRKRSAAARLL